MIALFGTTIVRWIATAGITAGLLGGSYVTGFMAGKRSILMKLADQRVEVIQDGKVITDEILNSDDDQLCAVLGCD